MPATSHREDQPEPIRRPAHQIAISTAFLAAGQIGGVEQAYLGIVDALARSLPPDTTIRLIGRRNSRDRRPYANIAKTEGPDFPRNRFLWDTFVTPRFTRGLQSILFPNYFTPPLPRGVRKVTIIHDLQYLHYPEYFPARKRLWLRLAHEATLRLADTTIAISNFVRDDIIRAYGSRHEHRVVVLPPPIDWEAFNVTANTHSEGIAPIADAGEPFILSVSAHWPHKNIGTLLRAFAASGFAQHHYRLVLVGQRARGLAGATTSSDNLDRLITELNLDDRIRVTGYVDQATLAWLYRHATLFVFPSLFEGMGRPVIEALGFRLPVLAANRASIPEVSRGLGVLMEHPTSVNEMASLIDEMARNSDRFKPSPQAAAAIQDEFGAQRLGPEYARILLAG